MKILTCNIRYSGADDGKNSWEHRRNLCITVIASKSPDIICFQEMRSDQFVNMSSAFADYDSYALLQGPTGRRPVNCIFYRSNAYRRISAGGYWLSETPHVAGSKSWDSACVRWTSM